jgi:hypothetical protein
MAGSGVRTTRINQSVPVISQPRASSSVANPPVQDDYRISGLRHWVFFLGHTLIAFQETFKDGMFRRSEFWRGYFWGYY